MKKIYLVIFPLLLSLILFLNLDLNAYAEEADNSYYDSITIL